MKINIEMSKALNPALTLAGMLMTSGAAFAGTITSLNAFDAPGAGTALGQGTVTAGVNEAGVIVGTYTDANNVQHGFVRAANGTITTFDAPGAGTLNGEGTSAQGVNASGTITGYVTDANFTVHGFLRSPSGTFTTFDATGAGAGGNLGTYGYAINDAAQVTGSYLDVDGVSHGFIRAANGTITNFDAPGAGTAPGLGTLGTPFYGFNKYGNDVSSFLDAGNVSHAFVRTAAGAFSAFSVPGAGTSSGQGTTAKSINLFNQIAGDYTDTNTVGHGYLLNPNGRGVAFSIPGAGTSPGQGTTVSNVNLVGAIGGSYVDSGFVSHGYLLSSGAIQVLTFDAPGANTTTIGYGTVTTGLNSFGSFTGYDFDANGVNHGFVGTVSNSAAARNAKNGVFSKLSH